MEIVKLNSSNVRQIHSLFKEQFNSEAWTETQILESINSSSTEFYGIFDNNQLISVVSFLKTVDDINILDIATKQTHKRLGFATALLRFVLSLKKQNQTVSLEVKSKNNIAISFYQKFGFKTVHIRKNYYKDGDDALCMFLQ